MPATVETNGDVCQNCAATTDMFLCGRCVTELRDMLNGLPRWLEHLAETATGQTRMADGGRGGSGYSSRYRLKGEDNISHYLATYPGDSDEMPTAQDRRLREEAARRLALSAGRVNAKASDLFVEIHDKLNQWVDIFTYTETHPHFAAVPRNSLPGAFRMTQWLRSQISAVPIHPEAGRFYGDIKHAINRIESVINRPIPQKFLGPCPTWLERERKACGAELRTREDAVEITCRHCKRTHNCNRLQLLMVNDMEREKVTVDRLLKMNKFLPEEYRISERTLRHWRQHDKLKPCGQSEDGEPLYRWADVRRLRAENERKASA
jgi:hypothetical protein